MRVEDIVTLKDGSYNMSLVKGVLEHISGIFHKKRRYRVLGLGGTYPVYNRHHYGESNNAMLVDVDNLDFVLFTQERFCRVLAPIPESLWKRVSSDCMKTWQRSLWRCNTSRTSALTFTVS